MKNFNRAIMPVIMATTLLAMPAMGKDYDRFYFFGDSLSDDGNFHSIAGPVNGPGTAPPGIGIEHPDAYPAPQSPAVYGVGGVSNGPVWTRYIAPDHVLVGAVALLNATTTQSASFAWAGAAADISNALAPVPDGRLQASQFANPAFVDSATIDQAVAAVWLGGNDLLNQIEREDNFHAGTQPINAIIPVFESNGFNPGAQDRIDAAMGTAAAAIAATVQTALDQGVKTVVVNNMPDLSRTPRFLMADQHLRDAAHNGSLALNGAIKSEMAGLRTGAASDVQIIEIDMFEVFDYLLANPERFGFSNTSDQCLEVDACRQGSADEAAKYAFWDGIHPTTRTHQLIAALVEDVLNVGQVRGTAVRLTSDVTRMMGMQGLAHIGDRMAARSAITQTGMTRSNMDRSNLGNAVKALGRKSLGMDAGIAPNMADNGAPNLFIAFGGGISQLDEIGYSDLSHHGTRGMAAGADIANYSVTAGIDGLVAPNTIVGMAISYGWGSAEADDDTDVDLSSVSLYAYAGFQPGWFRSHFAFGVQTDTYDMERITGPGIAVRGEPDGLTIMAQGSIGADWQTGLWHIMPSLDLNYTDLEIDGFTETGGPALALSYSEQNASYLVGGVQLSVMRDFVRQTNDAEWRRVGQVQFGVGYEADLNDTGRDVQIENRSVTGAAPTIVAIDDRDRQAVTAHLQGHVALTEAVSMGLGYRGTVSTSDVKDDAHYFTAKLTVALGAINRSATHW